METPQDKVPLDYSAPPRGPRRSAVRLWLIAVVLLFVTIISGDSVLREFRHRELTQAYIQYMVTQDWRRINDSSYVPPPFVGRRYVYQTPFELTAFYTCILSGAIASLSICLALRRQ